MTELHDLVHEWAYRHCPSLLDDDEICQSLVLLLVQFIDFSILASRRQVYREIREEKSN